MFRNFVETAIIPTTWREVGVGVRRATLPAGCAGTSGITTGFDLSSGTPTSEEGLESPLGSIHQEGQLARAGDLSGFGALNYTGIPGLRVGGSVCHRRHLAGTAGLRQQQVACCGKAMRAGARGLGPPRALRARHHLRYRAVNLTLVGNPVLIPESFYGWYAQAAYVATLPNSWTLAPFARFERVNTGAGYAFIGAGLTPAALEAEEVTTLGFNLNIAQASCSSSTTRFRPGLGRKIVSISDWVTRSDMGHGKLSRQSSVCWRLRQCIAERAGGVCVRRASAARVVPRRDPSRCCAELVAGAVAGSQRAGPQAGHGTAERLGGATGRRSARSRVRR